MSESRIDRSQSENGPFSGRRRSQLRTLLGVSLTLAAIAGLHAYIGRRLVGGTGLHGAWAAAAWVLIWALLLSVPLGFFSSSIRPRRLGLMLRWIAFCWIGVFGLVLSAVVLTDLVRASVSLISAPSEAQRLLYGQRQALAILCLVLPSIAVGVWTARGRARIERVTVALPRLGPGLQGLRIVQITDVHVGPTVGKRFLERIVDQVNELDPDVVVITGDLVDGPVHELRDQVSSLARLRTKNGTFFVTGNHEYYSGAEEWVVELRRLGITVLHNEHRVLERGAARLVLGGVTDYHGGQFSAAHQSRPDLAFAGAPKNLPRVLLAHQPRSAEAAASQQVDLQLSGHTHGGQIFPFMFFVRLQQPIVSGLRRLYGIWVYVSRGTGYWGPPMRVGSSPEISEITLVLEQARSEEEPRSEAC